MVATPASAIHLPQFDHHSPLAVLMTRCLPARGAATSHRTTHLSALNTPALQCCLLSSGNFFSSTDTISGLPNSADAFRAARISQNTTTRHQHLEHQLDASWVQVY